MRKYKILYEDADLFVLYKPSGLAIQNARPSVPDVMSMLRNDLANHHEKNTELYLINRLDQPVEGIFLIARNRYAAEELNRQFRARSGVEKRYRALVYGRPKEPEGRLVHYLKKAGGSNLSLAVPEGTKDAKRCELYYRVIQSYGDKSLLDIQLMTGRHHQIRVQMASAGTPIVGDTKYGKQEEQFQQLSLCSCKISFVHPRTKAPLTFQVEPSFSVPPTAP